MTLRDTWADWLGPAATAITDDQLERLDTAATEIANRWADPDLDDDRTTALSIAAQVILGDTTLEEIGVALQQARRREHECMVALTGALLVSDGSERDLGARAGVARMTVRKALGR